MKQGPVIESIGEARKRIRFDFPHVLFDLADCGGIVGYLVYDAMRALFAEDATLMKFPFPLRAFTRQNFEVIPPWRIPRDVMRRCSVRWAAVDETYINVCVVGHLPDDAIIRWDVVASPSKILSGESPWTGLGYGHINGFGHRVPSTDFMVPFIEGAELRVWAAGADTYTHLLTEPQVVTAPLVRYEKL